IAVDHREAGAVERESDAAPGPIERIVDDESVGAVGRLLDPRPRLLLRYRRHLLARLRRRRAELHHGTLKELRFQLGVRRRLRPLPVLGRALRNLGRHLRGAAVADVDLDRSGLAAALDAGAELVA